MGTGGRASKTSRLNPHSERVIGMRLIAGPPRLNPGAETRPSSLAPPELEHLAIQVRSQAGHGAALFLSVCPTPVCHAMNRSQPLSQSCQGIVTTTCALPPLELNLDVLKYFHHVNVCVFFIHTPQNYT